MKKSVSSENIRTLKIIRMLDMPIEQIRLILEGNLSMEEDGLGMQKAELEQQTQKQQAAILFYETDFFYRQINIEEV